MQGALHRGSRSEDGMESSVVAVVVVVVIAIVELNVSRELTLLG